MRLSDLGERKLIKRMEEFLDIGDDAACIKIDDRFLVVSTDMVYRKTHILKEMSFEQIGHKIVSMCFSDIASMGAKPIGFLLSYGSPDIDFENFDELIRGIKEQAERYGTEFVGGDTNEVDELTLAGTALGFTDKPVFRKGATIGEIVGVTSDLGGGALGVKILLENMVPLSEIPANVLQRTLDPEPRVGEGVLLGNYASAMTDISDSLAVSLYDIAERSGVGIEVELDDIPFSDSTLELGDRLSIDILNLGLYGGGDYELLFTTPEERWSELEDEFIRRSFAKVTKIGRVVEGSGASGIKDGKEFGIRRRGYEHFK